MFLNKTDYFKATDDVELLGVVIDNKLNTNHISKLIKKVGRQSDVLNRFKHILLFSTKIRIYRAFITPHFSYCAVVPFGTAVSKKIVTI